MATRLFWGDLLPSNHLLSQPFSALLDEKTPAALLQRRLLAHNGGRGVLATRRCPPAPAQPPGYVFAIVWPFSTCCWGAMYRMRDNARVLAVLTVLILALNAWWIRFGNM
jgi:hypothetical protein